MRLYRCWCRHEWPADQGPYCPNCGRETDFPAFVRTVMADGLVEDQDEGSDGTVATLNLAHIQPGTYLDGELFVGSLDSPEFDAWCEAHGLEDDPEVGEALLNGRTHA